MQRNKISRSHDGTCPVYSGCYSKYTNICHVPIGSHHPPPPFKFPHFSDGKSVFISSIPAPLGHHKPAEGTQQKTKNPSSLNLPTFGKKPRKRKPTSRKVSICILLLIFPSGSFFFFCNLFSILGSKEKFDKTGLPLWMLGLSVERLRADMNRLLALLFHQGVLDEQFLQLQQLQDESSPNFVSEVVNIYFHESEKLLKSLRGLLVDREFSDYKKMGIHLNQFMGSSSSIGAQRVRNVCVAFRAAAELHNRAGCLRALELLECEYCYLKNKLHELFQIEQQRILAAAVRYPVQQHPNNP